MNGPLTAGGTLIVPTSAVLKGRVTTNTHSSWDRAAARDGEVYDRGGHRRAGRLDAEARPGQVRRDPGRARAGRSCPHGGDLLSDIPEPSSRERRSTSTRRRARSSSSSKRGFAFAGEEKQEGSDGHVLIATFGCEPSFLSAPFHGTVSAQNAWLSMIAPGREPFVGRFFANSIEVGADTTVVGLPHPASGRPRSPGRRPRGRRRRAGASAAPPGLLRDDPNGWRSVPCATDEFINSHFPHPDAQLGDEFDFNFPGNCLRSGRGHGPEGGVRAERVSGVDRQRKSHLHKLGFARAQSVERAEQCE